jgi:transposase
MIAQSGRDGARGPSTLTGRGLLSRPKRNRGALPAHLPRVEVIADVQDKACACCGGLLHQISEDRAEMLDYVPAQFRVRLIRRPRLAAAPAKMLLSRRLRRIGQSTAAWRRKP